MKIRSLQIWSKEDLFNEYLQDADNTFDAITLGISVYIRSNNKVSKNEFFDSCKTTVINKYVEGSTYEDYLNAKQVFASLLLPDKQVILTSCTDFTKEQFNDVSTGRFIPPSIKAKQSGIINFIYNSNKIEDINVTLNDTTTLLAGGNVPNIKYDDMAAVVNHKDCFTYRTSLDDFPVSAYQLCRMHYELMKGIKPDAGRIRTSSVYIGSASHEFPGHEYVHELLKKLNEIDTDDIILKAALVHGMLVNIHPFTDGNGRISRLVTYPYTNIPFEDRIEYYQACDAYGAYKSIQPMYNLLHSLNPKSREA